jgi:selenocysteine lyase/cysteine desulfurase
MKEFVDRSDFPATKNCAYLNAASIALMPKVAGETIVEWNRELAERGTTNFDEEAEDTVFRDLHQAAARLYGARDDDIAVASSATEFLCSLAWAIYPEQGTNIVTTDIEHPTVTYPWMRVAKHSGAQIRMAKGSRGAAVPEDVIKLIDDQTSVVLISHVEYGSGECFDLAELSDIAHRHEALLIVDASQSSGAVPIDVVAWEIDALISTGYKWLCGPFGAAILYINPKLSHLEPGLVGWRSTTDVWNFIADKIEYPNEGRRFEFSTMNYGSAIALARAIEYLLEVGIERIFKHNIALADLLLEGLKELGGNVSPYPDGLRSSIVNVQFPGLDQKHIAAGLNSAGVIVSPRMGGIRISPHLYNTIDDINQALSVLKDLLI